MNWPEEFVNSIQPLMGDTLWTALTQGLEQEPPVSVRLNPAKGKGMMPHALWLQEKVPWCPQGYYLNKRPNFTFDPLLHAGCYYVQEASSMFVDAVLRQHAGDLPVCMLDMCAAPGGKSTAAKSALPAGSLLLSNEPVRQRAQVLSENIQKYGDVDVMVTNNYPEDFLTAGLSFDVLLTDVPCSGEGMFRKDEDAVAGWSLSNVDKCAQLQRDIVTDAWQLLRPGGLFIYSTCTFNVHEDEENVCYMAEHLGAEVLPVNTDDSWHIHGSLSAACRWPVYRFIPGCAKGEGLFMAVMRKPGSGQDILETLADTKKTRREQKKKKQDKELAFPDSSWLVGADGFEVVEQGTLLRAIPKRWCHIYNKAASRLKVLSAGVALGERKGRDIVPAPSLALSQALNADAFPRVELDYLQAVSYLRKEAITLPPDTKRGFVVVTFRGVPLGFVKNIGSRANNLYPAEWKIKSTYTPQEQHILDIDIK